VSDRVTVCRFDWHRNVAAETLCLSLQARGFDARMLLDWPDAAILVMLPASEVPVLCELQRADPGQGAKP
jgi:hypothetical protein